MSTLRTISGFKSALAGGGARPNLFEVSIDTFPPAVGDRTELWSNEIRKEFRFLCKASNIPASNIASIDVPFRGRIFKVAGDRTIDNWSVTVINDENFNIRSAFEAWHNAIAKLDNNSGATSPAAYMSNAFVYQLGRGYSQGLESTSNSDTTNNTRVDPLRTYKFVDIWPVSISDIALSYDSGDSIEEYTVEFAVQNIEIGAGGDQSGTKIS